MNTCGIFREGYKKQGMVGQEVRNKVGSSLMF